MSPDTTNISVSPKRIGIKIGVLAVALVVIWVGKPLFHGIIYRMVYSPGGLYVLGLPSIVGIVLYFWPPMADNLADSVSQKGFYFGLAFVIGIVLAVTLGTLGGMFEERHLANEAMDRAEETQDLPQANAQNPRIIPRAVADVQTRGSVSYRQHQLGPSDIARAEDGRLVWSYPIQPDQFQNQLNGNQRGVLLSDMGRMENRQMDAYDQQDFTYGQNMLLHRSAEWNLKQTDYWVQYRDDPIEFTHDGDAYMAFTKTGHEWNLLPVPHTTPTWEGVALVHQDGTIEHLSPEEARNSEILEGQRLYPIYNSQRYAQSLGYRNGIINQMPLIGSYSGVVEPASMPEGASNSQPFVIDLEGERMTYIYTMEPAGEQTRGLDEVWFFNSRTGEMEFYRTGDESLIGPERAMGLVRSEDSRTGWARGSEDGGNFRVVEPVATFIDDELWWHAKVVPVDNTDVSRNSFVNAHTGNVVELEDTESVIQFMSGVNESELEDPNVETEQPEDGDSTTVYVVITDENGNVVDRIPVDSTQNVEIQVDSGSEGTNETDG